MKLESLRFKFFSDLLKSNILPLLFPIFSPQLQLQLRAVFAGPFTLLGRQSQLSVQGFSVDFLSLSRNHDFLISISLQ